MGPWWWKHPGDRPRNDIDNGDDDDGSGGGGGGISNEDNSMQHNKEDNEREEEEDDDTTAVVDDDNSDVAISGCILELLSRRIIKMSGKVTPSYDRT